MARSSVNGGREIASILRGMSQRVTPATVQRVHKEALEPMQSAAQSNFVANGSYMTGVIPANIAIVPTEPMQTSLAMAGMGAKLGHLIELGTAPHEQPARGSWHPGSEPKPFMRPAFDQMAPLSLRTAGNAYGAELTRLWNALRR